MKSQMLFVILSFVIFTGGCATVVESARVVAGLSTKELEAARGKAVKQAFNYDYNTCYEKAREFAAKKEFYIYARDKQMIALYLNSDPELEMSTTPVGLFFKEVDASNTQVEVASQSVHARDLFAKRLFAVLEGKRDPREEEEEKKKNAKKS